MNAPVPSLVEALLDRARTHPEAPAFRTLVAGGAPTEDVWRWARWAEASRRVARALREAGVEPGDRVAILAGNVPLWPVVDLGAQWAGAVTVGLYPTSAPVQVAEVLSDCGAVAAFAGDDAQDAKLREALPSLPALRLVVHADEVAPTTAPGEVRRVAWSAFLGEVPGRATGDSGSVSEPPLPDPDADAVLIYTSGSTGAPKGTRITHRTLVASAGSVRDTLGLVEEDRSLSFLPYCHAAERIFGLATRIVVGMEAGLVPDANRVFEAATAFRPTVFGGLPRFYEKIYEAELADREAAEPPQVPAVARHLGDAVRVATSGGATLPVEVARTLRGLGLTVLGAYGLTEHLCAAFQRADDPELEDTLESVGLPMPGTEVRIADDGEILLRRSDLTFQGYWGRPEETEAAFTRDGAWLRTGDEGALDDTGHLYVTGRKKDLLALSTGKKVAPSRIEAWLVEQPWIAQAVLFGEGRKFVSALLTLRRPVVEAWARHAGLAEGWNELAADPRVLDEVRTQVEAVNARVSRTESVRAFEILAEPFTTGTGELTPTLKVRRDVVAARHAQRVDALYQGAAR